MNQRLVIVVALLVVAVILIGCGGNSSTVISGARQVSKTAAGPSVKAICTEGWTCSGDMRYFLSSSCSRSQQEQCQDGCSAGNCLQHTAGHDSADGENEIKIVSGDYTEVVNVKKSEIFELQEQQVAVVDIDDQLVSVKVLVIDDISDRVKLKIDGDRSYGIKEGSSIILKDEEHDADEIYIEIVDLKLKEDSTYAGPKIVVMRLGKLID